jgi:SAM-dependent methyltransferase
VAARYDRGVDSYVALWSPVILPPALSVIAALDLRSSRRVLDLGTGSGALVPHLRVAAPTATLVGLDPSREMLRVARHATSLLAIEGDAVSLPLSTGSVDGALLAFVLFHLSDPAAAMAEVARVVTAGRTVGTVTWVRDGAIGAYEVWDATLTEAGAPPLPALRVDSGLDSPEAVDALLADAGLRTVKVWTEDLEHQWDAPTYWQLATGSGVNRTRLDQLEPQVRAETLDSARRRLDALPSEAFRWSGQVVCAVGAKPGKASPR